MREQQRMFDSLVAQVRRAIGSAVSVRHQHDSVERAMAAPQELLARVICVGPVEQSSLVIETSAVQPGTIA